MLDLAADLGADGRRSSRRFARLPFGKPRRDALEARPPQLSFLGTFHHRREMFAADLAQFFQRIVRQRRRR